MGGMAAAHIDPAALAPHPRDRRRLHRRVRPHHLPLGGAPMTRPANADPDPDQPPDTPAAMRWVKLTFVDVFGTQLRAHAARRPAGRGHQRRASCSTARRSKVRPATSSRTCACWPTASTLVDHGTGEGRVVCTVLTPDGSPWAGDPRTGLVQALEATGELAELLHRHRRARVLPARRGGRAGRPGRLLRRQRRSSASTSVKAAADELVRAGVPVASAHHEGGAGQFELDLGPLDALGLADALVGGQGDAAAPRCGRAAWWPPSWPSRCRACPGRACTCTSGPATCCSTTPAR